MIKNYEQKITNINDRMSKFLILIFRVEKNFKPKRKK